MLTIEEKVVILSSTVINTIYDLLKQACSNFSEGPNATNEIYGEQTLRSNTLGIKALKMMEDTIGDKLSATCFKLYEIRYLDFDHDSEKLLNTYLSFLNDVLYREGLSSTDCIKNIRKPVALIREILYRFAAVALCKDNDFHRDGEKIINAIDSFCFGLLQNQILQEGLIQRRLSASGRALIMEHRKLLDCLREAVENNKMLNRNHDTIKESIRNLTSLKKHSLRYLATIFSDTTIFSDSLKEGSLDDSFLETTFKRTQKKIADKAPEDFSGDITICDFTQKMLQLRIVDRDNVTIRRKCLHYFKDDTVNFEKIKMLYEFLDKNNSLLLALSAVSKIILVTGWIPILLGFIAFDSISSLLSEHYDFYCEHLQFPSDNEFVKKKSYLEFSRYQHSSYFTARQLFNLNLIKLNQFQDGKVIDAIREASRDSIKDLGIYAELFGCNLLTNKFFDLTQNNAVQNLSQPLLPPPIEQELSPDPAAAANQNSPPTREVCHDSEIDDMTSMAQDILSNNMTEEYASILSEMEKLLPPEDKRYLAKRTRLALQLMQRLRYREEDVLLYAHRAWIAIREESTEPVNTEFHPFRNWYAVLLFYSGVNGSLWQQEMALAADTAFDDDDEAQAATCSVLELTRDWGKICASHLSKLTVVADYLHFDGQKLVGYSTSSIASKWKQHLTQVASGNTLYVGDQQTTGIILQLDAMISKHPNDWLAYYIRAMITLVKNNTCFSRSLLLCHYAQLGRCIQYLLAKQRYRGVKKEVLYGIVSNRNTTNAPSLRFGQPMYQLLTEYKESFYKETPEIGVLLMAYTELLYLAKLGFYKDASNYSTVILPLFPDSARKQFENDILAVHSYLTKARETEAEVLCDDKDVKQLISCCRDDALEEYPRSDAVTDRQFEHYTYFSCELLYQPQTEIPQSTDAAQKSSHFCLYKTQDEGGTPTIYLLVTYEKQACYRLNLTKLLGDAGQAAMLQHIHFPKYHNVYMSSIASVLQPALCTLIYQHLDEIYRPRAGRFKGYQFFMLTGTPQDLKFEDLSCAIYRDGETWHVYLAHIVNTDRIKKTEDIPLDAAITNNQEISTFLAGLLEEAALMGASATKIRTVFPESLLDFIEQKWRKAPELVYICPFSLRIIREAVKVKGTNNGTSYDKTAVDAAVRFAITNRRNTLTCPISNEALSVADGAFECDSDMQDNIDNYKETADSGRQPMQDGSNTNTNNAKICGLFKAACKDTSNNLQDRCNQSSSTFGSFLS